VVKSLKEKLFEGSITQAAYDAAIAPIQAQNGLIFTIWHINWLYYCQILFVITAAIMVTVSLLTKAPDPKTVRFTWYGATPEEKAATRASWGTIDVVLSVVAVLFVIAFYITFF
jgi:SSS family solute:Na+ symporter